MRRVLRALLILVYALLIIGFGAWGTLALWYRLPLAPEWRTGLAGLWAVGMLALLVSLFFIRRNRVMGTFIIAASVLLGWWSTLQPSNARDWAPDVARTVRGEITGDTLKGKSIKVIRRFLPRKSNLAMHQAAATPNTTLSGTAMAQASKVSLMADQVSGLVMASQYPGKPL